MVLRMITVVLPQLNVRLNKGENGWGTIAHSVGFGEILYIRYKKQKEPGTS